MKENRKIVEHKMLLGKKEHKLYTIGPKGAEMIQKSCKPDYWFEYEAAEAYKRIVAVEVCLKLIEYLSVNIADTPVKDAQMPFIYNIDLAGKRYQIGVIWSNLTSFIEVFRWAPPLERTILACKSTAEADALLEYLNENHSHMVRIIPADKIRSGLIFYKAEGGRWVLDLPDKKTIKTTGKSQPGASSPELEADGPEKPKKLVITRKKSVL